MASVILAILKIALLISVIIGRNYILSLVVYGLYVLLGIYNIIVDIIDTIKYAGDEYMKIFAMMGGAAVLSTLAYALLFIIVFKYGYKASENMGPKPKVLFYLPALIMLISGILNYFSYPYMAVHTAILTIITLVLFVISLFFLGRFYYEDN